MKAGEKMLRLDICFKLPADFNGDLNDAIEALLKYRRSEKNHDKIYTPNPAQTIFDNWWDMIHETDRPFYGAVGLEEYSGDIDNPWKNLPL